MCPFDYVLVIAGLVGAFYSLKATLYSMLTSFLGDNDHLSNYEKTMWQYFVNRMMTSAANQITRN
jgi:hypothetical protein